MKQLRKILANILEIDENQITDGTSPENVETWDSFNGLMLISELENEFNVVFTMNETRQIKNVGDIITILSKHGVKFIRE